MSAPWYSAEKLPTDNDEGVLLFYDGERWWRKARCATTNARLLRDCWGANSLRWRVCSNDDRELPMQSPPASAGNLVKKRKRKLRMYKILEQGVYEHHSCDEGMYDELRRALKKQEADDFYLVVAGVKVKGEDSAVGEKVIEVRRRWRGGGRASDFDRKTEAGRATESSTRRTIWTSDGVDQQGHDTAKRSELHRGTGYARTTRRRRWQSPQLGGRARRPRQ